jgi:rubrerythrin
MAERSGLPLKGTQTEENLKRAFAHESQVNRRYLYFAQHADKEGHAEVAAVFRATAESETSHAHGTLQFLEQAGDPESGAPFGDTESNLQAAIAGESREAESLYPEMARIARAEGFEQIARWFEALAKAETSHVERFRRALRSLRR